MLILVPAPLTTSKGGDGEPVDLAGMSFPELNDDRLAVLDALGETRLLAAPTMRARDLYRGVLMDTLLRDLPPAALDRVDAQLVYISGAWGAVRPTDELPGSRDSMYLHPKPIGSLPRYWNARLDVLGELAGSGLIVDLRSSDTLSAWSPPGELADRWVRVRSMMDAHFDRGSMAAVSRRTRGQVGHRILLDGIEGDDPADLADALAPHFRIQLRPPETDGGPTELRVVQP